MSAKLSCIVVAVFLLSVPVIGQAQVRLLGITGLQGAANDNTLYEINIEDGGITELLQLTFIPDTHAIGFNPDDGLLYHTAGSESWTDDPNRVGGFRDHQYLETVNLETGELTPIFNANPAPSPDEFPSFGLPAPLPNFIEPKEIRLVNDPGERQRGENEYHGIRGLTWSDEEKLFYASDEHGLFKLDAEGESTFVGQPLEDSRNLKGITFYEENGITSLLTGTKRNGNLWTLDPTTGLAVDDPIEMEVPAGSEFASEFGGLLAMAQHPENGALFGVRRTDPDAAGAMDRELVIVFPGSGETVTVANLGQHFASLAFVYPTDVAPPWPGDVNGDGKTNVADLNIIGVNWQSTGVTMAQGDLTGDGNVDAADLNILAINWQTSRDPMPAAVPEPGSLALLLLGLMSTCAYLRK